METRIPILKMKQFLVVPIQVDMDDATASRLQQDILLKIEKTGSVGVLIDISVLEMVDSYLGRILGDTARMANLMGAEVMLVGMQPAVAITLIELGLRLDGIHTALNMEQGLERLEDVLAEK